MKYRAFRKEPPGVRDRVPHYKVSYANRRLLLVSLNLLSGKPDDSPEATPRSKGMVLDPDVNDANNKLLCHFRLLPSRPRRPRPSHKHSRRGYLQRFFDLRPSNPTLFLLARFVFVENTQVPVPVLLCRSPFSSPMLGMTSHSEKPGLRVPNRKARRNQ